MNEKDKNEKLLNIVATLTENSEKQAEKIEALAADMKALVTFKSEVVVDIDELRKRMSSVDVRLNSLETCNAVIPPTFLISPQPQIEKLKESTSVTKKLVNYICRSKGLFVKLLWNECLLKFFCPILEEFVSCGVDGKGYTISSPTSLLKTIVPVMKYGVLFVKIALATQGLGALFPDIPLPDVDCSDYLSSLLQEVVDGGKSVLTDQVNTKLDDLVETFKAIQSSDTEVCTSYQSIFDMLRDIEKKKSKQKDSRPSDTLKYSGLKKVRGMTGEFMWVSPVAVDTYRQYGYDEARKKFSEERFCESKKKSYHDGKANANNLLKKK